MFFGRSGVYVLEPLTIPLIMIACQYKRGFPARESLSNCVTYILDNALLLLFDFVAAAPCVA